MLRFALESFPLPTVWRERIDRKKKKSQPGAVPLFFFFLHSISRKEGRKNMSTSSSSWRDGSFQDLHAITYS